MPVRERTTSDLLHFGEEVAAFFHEGRRSQMVSPLFNVPARMVCGAYCFYEALPEILRELTATISPAELGTRMRALGARPNYISLHALALGYLNGREQARLRLGLPAGAAVPGEPAGDAETVMSFWRQVGDAYLGEGSLLPSRNGGVVEILHSDEAGEIAERVRERAGDELAAVRRTVAELELYTFVQNGEARTGVAHHGPYPLPDGDLLVVKELTGLRARSLPWELEAEMPFDAVVRVLRLRDVEARLDMFGTLIADPFDYADRVVGDLLLARRGEELREIGAEEGAAAGEIASRNQLAMYRQAIGWDDSYRVAYGADQYAAHVSAFTELAGLDLGVRARFEATVERVLPGLVSGEDTPLVLDWIDRAPRPLYSPLAGDTASADA
jgi:hypothetical protein